MIAPFFAGAVAAIAGEEDGWRWAFALIGLVALPIALSALTIHEPRRGRHEMQSVLGEELPEEADELPISLSVAFERLRQIRSFYYFLVGMAALGFALFSTPLFLSLYFEDELGLERVRTRRRRHDHRGSRDHRHRDLGQAGRRPVPQEPARGDGVRRAADRAASAWASSSRS